MSAGGYVTDVPYVRYFVADLAPARLRVAAALNGLEPPPDDDFDYCEIGCAHGDTLAALAAANPGGRFLGLDLAEAQIEAAQRMARDGGLDNVGFLARDVARIGDEDLGTFDFVVAHGFLSWVPPEARAALIAFAAARLKPGGLLYVTYNALPGWAAVAPLRELLASHTSLVPHAPSTGASTAARAGEAFAFARALADGGAEYFARNPAAAGMLLTMEKGGAAYVAHEYLNEHWAPVYFATVAHAMAERGLQFAGVLPPFMNFRDTAIPESLEPLFARVPDRARFEALKDYAVNEFFRRDLYVQGARPREAANTEAFLDGVAWGTVDPAASLELEVKLPHRTVDLRGALFDAARAALAEGAITTRALAQRAGATLPDARAALLRLLLAGQILPMRAPAKRRPRSTAARLEVPSSYNRMMLRRLATDTPIVLAAPACGTAFPTSTLEALAIRVLTEVAPPDRAAWIERLVAQKVLRLRVQARIVEAPEEQREVIADAVRALDGDRLAKLIELGIVAERAS